MNEGSSKARGGGLDKWTPGIRLAESAEPTDFDAVLMGIVEDDEARALLLQGFSQEDNGYLLFMDSLQGLWSMDIGSQELVHTPNQMISSADREYVKANSLPNGQRWISLKNLRLLASRLKLANILSKAPADIFSRKGIQDILEEGGEDMNARNSTMPPPPGGE